MKEVVIKRGFEKAFRDFGDFGTIGNELTSLRKNSATTFHLVRSKDMRRMSSLKRHRKPIPVQMEKHRDNERFRHQGLNATLEHLANRVPGYNSFPFTKTKIVKMQLMINYICHLESYISGLCKELDFNIFPKQCFLSSQLSQEHKMDIKCSLNENKIWLDGNNANSTSEDESLNGNIELINNLGCNSRMGDDDEYLVPHFTYEVGHYEGSHDCSFTTFLNSSPIEDSCETMDLMSMPSNQ